MYQKAIAALGACMAGASLEKKTQTWSVYFQTPDYLERTRLMLIEPEYEPLIGRWCGLREGAKVLDVGCGTGYFTRLLKRVCPQAQLTGLEKEVPFLQRAAREAEGLPIEYVEGDALALPFSDQSFDLVVSHTFLTSVPHPDQAMAEMKRVLRPGGRIASVTAMSFGPSVFYGGDYPEDCPWARELQEMWQELGNIYLKMVPLAQYAQGVPPHQVPGFFARQGLKNVCAYPLGKLFSLSNAAVPTAKKELWLKLYQQSEEDRLKAIRSLPGGEEAIPEEKAERYLELVRQKCSYYRSHPEENAIWEWQGGTNVLVTGDIDKEVG